MKTEPKTLGLSGKTYSSVEEMMIGLRTSERVRKKVAELSQNHQIVDKLIDIRAKKGLSQEQMAKLLGVSQSAISKLESRNDDKITIKDMENYARATGGRIHLTLGRQMSHAEAVKHHALLMKAHLEALAKIANAGEDNDIENGIKSFFAEAFANVLDILDRCNKQIPNNNLVEIRIQTADPQKDDLVKNPQEQGELVNA
jgi:transcriptional regulator with XRE-family HTH domain